MRVVLHSLAFGTLRPYVADAPGGDVTQKQIDMTLDVMANSLVYWTQGLVRRGLIGDGGRVFAMTSAGGTRIWPSYGPVSAAKAALESHIRQLACELAPKGITVNAVRAGVTDTPGSAQDSRQRRAARRRAAAQSQRTPHHAGGRGRRHRAALRPARRLDHG